MAYVNAEREHLIEVVTETGKMYKALSLELDEAKAEIERLHDALAPFSCTCREGYCQYQQHDGGFKTCPHYIVRAALEDKRQ